MFFPLSLCYIPNIYPCRNSPTACLMLGDFHLLVKYPAESVSEEELQVCTVSDQQDLLMVCSESCLLGNPSLHHLCSPGWQVHVSELAISAI